MMPSWIASAALARPVEDVADGRLGVGIDVQVVGQVALRVEVDRQHLEPERRKTSRRVRTVVVLPVPPFWERTAMVAAMGGGL